MEISIQRAPLYVGRQGAHVTLGGITLTPDKARDVSKRLVLVADSFDADDFDVLEPDNGNGRLDREASADDRDYQAAKEG